MTANGSNNSRHTLFHGATDDDLQAILQRGYVELIKAETEEPYWMFGECLREIQKRKGLSAKECIGHLGGTFGFSSLRLKYAQKIRDKHADRESASSTPLRALWADNRNPKVERGTNGQARRFDMESVSPPKVNGDGKPSSEPQEAMQRLKGLRLLSEVEARPTEWLWPGYIPLGELTIIEGHPGTNKSLLMIHLAAILTQGNEMPYVPAEEGDQ